MMMMLMMATTLYIIVHCNFNGFIRNPSGVRHIEHKLLIPRRAQVIHLRLSPMPLPFEIHLDICTCRTIFVLGHEAAGIKNFNNQFRHDRPTIVAASFQHQLLTRLSNHGHDMLSIESTRDGAIHKCCRRGNESVEERTHTLRRGVVSVWWGEKGPA
ncbi:hypothetical protein Scep_002963 [Stephania cephalantha]|uniref:Secreted protein n=1 Tax=Stephania cephalantha TaxID=152367 RepID=A0AAP0LAV8_9MAGN